MDVTVSDRRTAVVPVHPRGIVVLFSSSSFYYLHLSLCSAFGTV